MVLQLGLIAKVTGFDIDPNISGYLGPLVVA
jgi:hypothetical protein